VQLFGGHTDGRGSEAVSASSQCKPLMVLQTYHVAPSLKAQEVDFSLFEIGVDEETRRPSFVSYDSRMKEVLKLEFNDRLFIINSGYAALHGYGYIFMVPSTNITRHPAWARIPGSNFIERSFTSCQSKMLFTVHDS
jgi:hypothetical protein